MSDFSPKGFRVVVLALFGLALFLCQAKIVQTVFGIPDAFATAMDGIVASWEKSGLVVKEPPSPRLVKLGYQKGDNLVGIEDARGVTRPLRSPLEMRAARKGIAFGEPFAVHILRHEPGGGEEKIRIAMQPASHPPNAIWRTVTSLLPQILFFLLCFVTALFIGFSKPEDSAALNASLLFLCFATLIWKGIPSLFSPGFREVGLLLWIFPFSFATALFMRFFLVFPTPSPIDRRFPWIKKAGLLFGLIFSVWNYAWHYMMDMIPSVFDTYLKPIRGFDYVLDVIYVACFLVGLTSLLLNTLKAEGVDDRRRGRILLCGSAGFLPWLCVYIYSVTLGPPKLPEWVFYLNLLFLTAFPAAFAYAVVRHRVFGIRVILRRGLRFALLSRAFLVTEGVVLFLLLYYGAMPLVGGILKDAPPAVLALGTAGTAALVVMGFWKLNRFLMPRAERHFFREAYDARAVLSELARSVRKLSASPEALFSTVTSTLLNSLHPDRTAVFLQGAEILRMPASEPAHKALARGRAKERPGDFYCLWSAGPGWSAPVSADTAATCAILSGDCAVARRLAECASREVPEALEMYPDKARSWTASVVQYGSGEDVRFVLESGFRLLVPLASREKVLGFLALGDKLSEEPYSREDVELLMAVGQQMADNLEYADLLREGQEQAILRREVEIAREVQEKLLIKQPAPFPKLDYAGACRPARFVGGDYYDYIRYGESGLGFALGDVSGKGVSAALLMAGLQAALRVRADIHGEALEVVFSEINRHMCVATDDGRFATLFYGVFDAEALRLDYVNAGHNPPLLLRAGSGDMEHLKSTGPILGLSPESRFARGTAALHPGDILILYSDGVTEALNELDDFYGDERLEELVTRLRDAPASAICDAVFADVDRFAGERNQNDDITVVAIRVTADEPRRLAVLDSASGPDAKSTAPAGA